MSQPRRLDVIQRLLAIYVFLLPFEDLWVYLIGVDTEFKPYRLAGIVLFLLWFGRCLGGRARLRIDGYDAIFLTFLGLGVALTAMWSFMRGGADMGYAISKSILLVFVLTTYIAVKNTPISRERFERLLTIFLYAVCISVVLGVLLRLPTVSGRFVSFYGQANRLGLAIAVALHVMIAQTLGGGRVSTSKYVWRAAMFLGLLVALLFTGSRGSMLALACSLPLHGVALVKAAGRRGRAARRLSALAPLVLVGGIVVAATFGEYGEEAAGLRRVVDPAQDATSGRYDIWRSALDASVDYYLLGMGAGQYRAHHRAYINQLDSVLNPRMKQHDLETHNEILNVLTSYGLLGLALYIGLVVSLFRRLRAWAQTAGEQGWLQIVLLPLLGHLVIGGLTAVLIYGPTFFLLMSIMTHVVRRQRASRGAHVWAGQISALEIARRVPRPQGIP